MTTNRKIYESFRVALVQSGQPKVYGFQKIYKNVGNLLHAWVLYRNATRYVGQKGGRTSKETGFFINNTAFLPKVAHIFISFP